MKRYKFIGHSGTTCPVEPDTIVVYRTTSITTPVSHIHHPLRAGDLTWDDSEQYMGSILVYARHIPNVKYIRDETVIDMFSANR